MKNKILFMTVAIITIVLSMSAQEKGTFTDSRDGKVYKTVKIGTQTWMAENLAYNASGCWAYDNNQSNVATYGYLYFWEVAQVACPNGWHLPTIEEYNILLANYGGSGKTAYKALKDGGKSGFSALFGGSRSKNGTFYNMYSTSFFWSSSGLDGSDAWYLDLGLFDKKEANTFISSRNAGLSVRCVKD